MRNIVLLSQKYFNIDLSLAFLKYDLSSDVSERSSGDLKSLLKTVRMIFDAEKNLFCVNAVEQMRTVAGC